MSRPLDVHLYVTPRCNLSCPHCYYDALDRGRQPPGILTLDDIARIISGLCGRFDADISLEGGEPFLRTGLGAMLATLDASVLGCITVTTNGTVRMATPTTTLAQLGDLRLSIDGHTDEFQQELRGIAVAPVLATCAKLRSVQVPHTVRMTLYRRNVRLLEEIYGWVEAHDIARLSLFEYQASGRGIGQELIYGVGPGDIDRLLGDLARLPRPDGLEVLTLNLAQRRVDAVLAQEDALSAAGVAVRRLPRTANCTVNYDGSVGVSPWTVTAHGSPDVFTHTDSPDFLEQVEKAAAAGSLQDEGPCISRVQLRCER